MVVDQTRGGRRLSDLSVSNASKRGWWSGRLVTHPRLDCKAYYSDTLTCTPTSVVNSTVDTDCKYGSYSVGGYLVHQSASTWGRCVACVFPAFTDPTTLASA